VESVRRLNWEHDNDYATLDSNFRLATGHPLNGDPLAPAIGTAHSVPTTSVVIPAWNARATLERCLTAIGLSSFNARHSDRLEVVVIDDGSKDGTRELLDRMSPPFRLVAASQRHLGRAAAMNSGIAMAGGDVVVSCDADMLLTHGTLEALAWRHSLLKPVVLVGFRTDIQPGDRRLDDASLAALLRRPAITGDNRLVYDAHGWPDNMCLAMDHLRRMGRGRRLWMANGQTWTLARMVFGCLFSMLRSDCVRIGGFDESFKGWGWEDTHLAARAIAAGRQVVPVYAASGFHLAHGARSPVMWEEARRNRRRFQALIDLPFDAARLPVAQVAARIERSFVRERARDPEAQQEATCAGGSPLWSARALAMVGRPTEALVAACGATGGREEASGAHLLAGRILRSSGRHDEAVEHLHAAARDPTARADALIEIAWILASAGAFARARRELDAAGEAAPAHRELRYILRCPAHKHVRRGRRYARQGDHQIARRDFEAALMQNPRDRRAFDERALATQREAQGAGHEQ
jgi:glycosyltransferase involved in cell wall biosynthesis